MDPKLDQRVASFYDNQIMIWDTRSFDKPIVTQEQLLKVTKIEWCRSRQGLLGSAAENSTNLTIHDIQAWSHTGMLCLHWYETACVCVQFLRSSAATGDPAVTERRVKGWTFPSPATDALAAGAAAASSDPSASAAKVDGKRSKHPTGQQQTDEEHVSRAGNLVEIRPFG